MEHVQTGNGNDTGNKSRRYRYRNKNKGKNNLLISFTKFTSCPICKEHNIEISMPCAGMHSYCFSCIKKWSENKKELTCPECRKVCENIIKLPILKNRLSSEFLEFLESVKIIPGPYNHNESCKCFQVYFENTCIYPDWTIAHFVENKEQLELYYEIIKSSKYKDNPDEVIRIIKWFTISGEEEDSERRHN